MAVPEYYQRKDHWAHIFVRTGETKEMAPKTLFLWVPRTLAVKHYCHYCKIEWWQGKDPRPVGRCPARTDRTEMKRILG